MSFTKGITKICNNYAAVIYSTEHWPIERNAQTCSEYFQKRDNKGYIRKPLLQVEPECCPPDHLHMRRSLINRLLNQVRYLLGFIIEQYTTATAAWTFEGHNYF